MTEDSWKLVEDYLQKQVLRLQKPGESIVRIQIELFDDGECRDIGISFYFLNEDTDDYHREYIRLYPNEEFWIFDEIRLFECKRLVEFAEELKEKIENSSLVESGTRVLVFEGD